MFGGYKPMQNNIHHHHQQFAQQSKYGMDQGGGHGYNGQNMNGQQQNMSFIHYKTTPEEQERSPISAQIN